MRADRLISILMLLQTEGRLTAKELARRLEVSERTIYRDMDALSTAGVPLYADPGNGGGFALPPEYRTKADGLTTSEVQALFVHSADQLNELGIGASLRSGLLKLLNALPSCHRVDAEWIRNRVHLDSDAWTPQNTQSGYLQMAQQAVWEQRRMELSYTSRGGVRVDTLIEPLGLVAKAGIWFLVGASAEEGWIGSFRIMRIELLRLTDHYFDRPENFDLARYWQTWVERYRLRTEDEQNPAPPE